METLIKDSGEGIESDLEGTADLYAKVFINGMEFSNEDDYISDRAVINPNWEFSAQVPINPDGSGIATVTIQIWDDDDFSPDDQADIGPGQSDELNLVVDLGTGTWSGDTSDYCAEGSALYGTRVCFDIQLPDSDGDGLSDALERTIGSDPMHKDIFVELDWVPGFEPARAEISAVKAAFAAAPRDAGGVTNPDGRDGINLWIDTGSLSDADGLVGDNLSVAGPGHPFIPFGGGNPIQRPPLGPPVGPLDPNYYKVKMMNFDRVHRGQIFHYAIKADQNDSIVEGDGGPGSCSDGIDNDGNGKTDLDDKRSGCDGSILGKAELGGNDLVVYDNSSLMHELGHNLNLQHGGSDDKLCKPNYVSVMNYDHGSGIQQVDDTVIFDYSPPRFSGGRGKAPLETLKEDQLNEQTVLDPTDSRNLFAYVDGSGTWKHSRLDQKIDWNGNNMIEGLVPFVNIDLDCEDDNPQVALTMAGHDDWKNIKFNFRLFGDHLDHAINRVAQEPTIQRLLQQSIILHTTDSAISMVPSGDRIVTGTQVTYTLVVRNNGPRPVTGLKVTDVLPGEVSFVSASGGCSISGNQITCALDFFPVGNTATITILANVNCSIADGAQIKNVATILSSVGQDPVPADNRAEASIIASNPPPVITCPTNIVQNTDPGQCSAVVTFVATATDNCPGTVIVCNPPSESIFLKGDTTVECKATDSGGATAQCRFTISVQDKEPPRVACRPAPNPSDKKIPVAGKNPGSGQNPDGYYQLLGKDNCDPNPKLYVKDDRSSFIAGPFVNGDVVKLRQNPGGTPKSDPGQPPIVAEIHLNGDGLLYAVDEDGNVSDSCLMLIPPDPK